MHMLQDEHLSKFDVRTLVSAPRLSMLLQRPKQRPQFCQILQPQYRLGLAVAMRATRLRGLVGVSAPCFEAGRCLRTDSKPQRDLGGRMLL